MTRVYDGEGRQVPVTVVQAGPCVITQVKTADGPDAYYAIQLGFEDAKPKHSTYGLIGHDGKAGAGPKRHHREIRLDGASDRNLGDTVDVSLFDEVQFVDVTGTSKGKGFAGVMKRHGFHGQPGSHGTERKHRSPGSIGGRATNRGFNGRPKKGLRLPGQMGNETVTTRNHPVVRVDKENNLLIVKGAVPGANQGLVTIREAKRLYKAKAKLAKAS